VNETKGEEECGDKGKATVAWGLGAEEKMREKASERSKRRGGVGR
jgi:hypothetical protein